MRRLARPCSHPVCQLGVEDTQTMFLVTLSGHKVVLAAQVLVSPKRGGVDLGAVVRRFRDTVYTVHIRDTDTLHVHTT